MTVVLPLPVELADELADALFGDNVETDGWLVKEEDVGVMQ